MTGRRTPAQVLAESRRSTSLAKRQAAREAVERMLAAGEPVTFAGVARAAGVSVWLVYADGVREHVEQARARQQARPRHERELGRAASPAGLKTDLTLAKAEIAALRAANQRLQDTLRRKLGQQLDQVAAGDLIARINELTAQNRNLAEQLAESTAGQRDAEARLAETLDDLAAARESLRRMMREQNTAAH